MQHTFDSVATVPCMVRLGVFRLGKCSYLFCYLAENSDTRTQRPPDTYTNAARGRAHTGTSIYTQAMALIPNYIRALSHRVSCPFHCSASAAGHSFS